MRAHPCSPPNAVFDMGCAETASKADAADEAGGSVAGAFGATRDSLLPRPWVGGANAQLRAADPAAARAQLR